MISRKRLNLFPIIFEYHKYGLTFRRLGHCCNQDYYSLRKILLLKFIFKDKVYWRCPQCGKLHGLELEWHTVPYYDKDLREENRRLDEFRNGGG